MRLADKGQQQQFEMDLRSVDILNACTSNRGQGFFRDDAMDAQNPFSFTQALQAGQTYNPDNPDTLGTPVKDTLTRQQFGGTLGFPIRKDKTFLFFS